MWTTLGEYYDVRDGTHDSPKYTDSDFPLVTSKNLKDGKLNFSNIKYISEEDYLSINKRSKVEIGDVLMAMIGTIGNPVEIVEKPKFAIKNVALFKTNSEQSAAYLRYFLSHPRTVSRMMADAKGATQKFVGLGYLRNFPIFVPPLAEQQRIVAKLDAAFAEIDRAIEIAETKAAEVEKLKASVLTSQLSGADNTTLKLGDVCQLIYGKALDKEDRLEKGGYPAFGANGVKTNSKTYLFDKPSIIIGRKGSAGELNKVSEPFWALDVTYYTRINEKLIVLDYLFYVLTTLNLPSLARGVKPGINRNDVYEQIIPLPSLAEQQRIVLKLDGASKASELARTSIKKSIDDYKALKSAILAQELQPTRSEAA